MNHADEWKVAGIVLDGEDIRLDGLNPWDLKWQRAQEDPIMLECPKYSDQLYKFWIYRVESDSRVVKFAAGELSNNVWAFYLPSRPTSFMSKQESLDEFIRRINGLTMSEETKAFLIETRKKFDAEMAAIKDDTIPDSL
jgi:hypothetical protein